MKDDKRLIVYLVRHGNKDMERYRKNPKEYIHLSEEGKEQAKFLAKKFKGIKINKIYSSIAERCVETIEPTAKLLSKKINIENDLREVNPESGLRGLGKEHDKKERKKEIARVKKIWDKIIKNNGKIVVSAHGGTNRVILSLILGIDFENTKFTQNPTGVNEIAVTHDGRFALRHMNDISHLPPRLRNRQAL